MAAASLPDSGGPPEWPILSRVKRVYADAGLILAALMGPSDPFYEAVMRFFDAAEEAGVRVAVSSLTLMEVADVLRKRTKMRHKCRDESEEEREGVDADAAAIIARLVLFSNTRLSFKVVEILEEVSVATLNFDHLFKKIIERQGRTPRARRGTTYRHDGIGPIDMIHIVLARLAKIRVICTTDKALAQIKDDSMYGNMEIITLVPRPAPAERRKRRGRRR